MLGSFLSGFLIFVFGYVYPAYECYKTVELNKPKIEKLRFWCQYWILVAFLAVLEKFADFFFSWLPLYCEAKLILHIFLWYPKLRGTSYVYDTFFRPCISKYETDIDHSLLELRTRAADMMLVCLQKASSYGRSSLFEMMKNVILLVQAPIARNFQQTGQAQQPQQSKQSQQAQQTWEPQHELKLPPAAPPSPRPATPRQPPRERKSQSSPIKKRLQEQSRNVAYNLRSSTQVPQDQEKKLTQNSGKNQLQSVGSNLSTKSSIQSQESVPDTDRSGFAGEQPRRVDEINSQDVEDSDPQSKEASMLLRARSSLRKRPDSDKS